MLETLKTTISFPVQPGGSIRFVYPSGRTADSYQKHGEVLVLPDGTVLKETADTLSVAYDAVGVSVACGSGRTIPAGTVSLKLPLVAELLDTGSLPVTVSGVTDTIGNLLANRVPGVIRSTPATLPKWRKALAKARLGDANATIACIGDSTTMAQGGGTSGTNNLSGARARSWPRILASILTSSSLPFEETAVWGDGAIGASYSSVGYDPRMAIGAGWAPSGGSLGGGYWKNTTTQNALTFTPTQAFNTIDVWFIQIGGNATFTVDIGGAALATINSSGTNNLVKQTVSTGASAATGSINIKRTSTGAEQCLIMGIDAYDNSRKSVRVWNMGVAGSKVGDWTPQNVPWDRGASLGLTTPDLGIINLGINDWRDTNNTDTASFTTSYQNVIDRVRQSGDVIMVVPVPSSTTSAAAANQARIAQAIRDLAAANNCPLIDLTDRIGDYNAANTLGLYYDSLHPTGLGYADVGQAIARAIGF